MSEDFSEKDVYIIKCQNMYKIGIAADVDKRVKQLQTGSPKPLYPFCVFVTEDAPRAEKWLHNRYDGFRAMGEWFKLSRKEIKLLQLVEESECLDDWIEYSITHGNIQDYEELIMMVEYNAFSGMLFIDKYGVEEWDKRTKEDAEYHKKQRNSFKYEPYNRPCPYCKSDWVHCVPGIHYRSLGYVPSFILCNSCGYIWDESSLAHELKTYGIGIVKGMKVSHPKLGNGKIIQCGIERDGKVVKIEFDDCGRRNIILTSVKLTILNIPQTKTAHPF